MSVADPAHAGAPGDPGEAKVGLASLEEPNGTGGAVGTGTPNAAANAVQLQVRGSLYYPANKTTAAPLIMLVHGNHGSCNTGAGTGLGGSCLVYNRNDAGYAYLAANLASWGYVVFSLDQDQLIFYQDGSYGKGMHQRRLLMAAALDGLYQANQPGGLPVDDNDNVGTQLVGKIDFSRIGLMGHSRGGDAVSSFLDYNRTRPAPGRRYNIRAVIALAPTDYERRAPYGVVYSTMFGACDGDVSDVMGARMFERSLYISPTDPFPRIQMVLHGANHDAFNTEWDLDGDDASTADSACGPNTVTNPDSTRLGRGGNVVTAAGVLGTDYTRTNFFSDDPALMGDQARAGLAMMSEFFRRYVGGETPFDDYMTGVVSSDGTTPALPASACPTSSTGTHMACNQRVLTTYFAAPQERLNVIRPNPDQPLTVSELGTSLTGGGFADPYANSAGTAAQPATANGYDWCNPEPNQFTPSQLGITPTLPTAVKPCPLPGATALGGQSNGARENAPVTRSYGPQLTLAWTAPAHLETRIPALNGDVSKYKALALDAAVNYFDPRNGTRTGSALFDPAATTQNFTVSVSDAAGHTATVQAANPRYGLALHPTIGSTTTRVHIILNQLRIPLSDFVAQGVDLKTLRQVQFRFGDRGAADVGLDRARRRPLPGGRDRADGVRRHAHRHRPGRPAGARRELEGRGGRARARPGAGGRPVRPGRRGADRRHAACGGQRGAAGRRVGAGRRVRGDEVRRRADRQGHLIEGRAQAARAGRHRVGRLRLGPRGQRHAPGARGEGLVPPGARQREAQQGVQLRRPARRVAGRARDEQVVAAADRQARARLVHGVRASGRRATRRRPPSG